MCSQECVGSTPTRDTRNYNKRVFDVETIVLSSSKEIELIDITSRIEDILSKQDIENGLCNIFVPHATAGLIINENEPGLVSDFEKVLEQEFSGYDFKHNQIDNNARSHILSGFIGASLSIPFENKKLRLGTWQQIFLVELNGPRNQRQFIVNLIQKL